MYSSLKTVIRTSVGLVILMLGIIGLFLPILQGWFLILVAIPIISPAHGKKMVVKLRAAKEWAKAKWAPGKKTISRN